MEKRFTMNRSSPDRDCVVTVRVVLRAGAVVRRVDVWAATRTSLHVRLVTRRSLPTETHCRDAARTRWMSSFELSVGELVTTARGREPIEGELFAVCGGGLEPIGYNAAWDCLYPAGAAERAAQREPDARAAAADLPRELTRFVGAHTL